MSRDWPKVKLGDILAERKEAPDLMAIQSGDISIVSKIGFERGQIEIRQESNTKTGMILVRPGDLLISGINASKGAISIYGESHPVPVAATIHYGAYIINKKKASARYLWRYLRSDSFREILRISLPEGIKTELKSKRLLPLEIPLPPLAEQERIVARIEELAGKISEACALRKEAVEELNFLIKSTANQIFSTSKTTDTVKLSSLISSIESGKSPQCDSRPAEGQEWGVVKVGCISFGWFNPNENKALPAGMPFDKRHKINSGDFIMCRANSAELVGSCAIAPETLTKNLLLCDKTFRFVFKSGVKVDKNWLNYTLKSPPLREQMLLGASGTSPSMKNISKEKVLDLDLPNYTFEEQLKIVKELDRLQIQVDALKKLQSETEAELQAMLPAILDKAFKGEL